MSKKAVLLIHYGPYQSRVCLLDKKGTQLAESIQQTPPTKGQENTGEFNPLESIYNVRAAINQALQASQLEGRHLAGICITTKGNGCLAWEKDTGLPLTPGLTLDDRTHDLDYKKLIHDQLGDQFKSTTGFNLNNSLPAMTLKELLETYPEARLRAKRKNLCLGTIESWLLYNLTGRKVHATDQTHAAKTGLLDIRTFDWDTFLTTEFQIPKHVLPETFPAYGPFGTTNGFVSLPDGLPILAVCHDEIATCLGYQINHFGDCILSLEEDGWLVINSGVQPQIKPGDMTALVLAGNGQPRYGLKVPIKFPTMLLDLFLKNADMTSFHESTLSLKSYQPTNDSLYLVPNPDRPETYSLHGLSDNSTPEGLVQAYIEAMGFLIKQKIDHLNESIGYAPKQLRVAGSLNKHDGFLQFLADILQIPTLRLDDFVSQDWGLGYLAFHHGKPDAKPTAFSKPLKISKQLVPHLDPISSHAIYTQWRTHTN